MVELFADTCVAVCDGLDEFLGLEMQMRSVGSLLRHSPLSATLKLALPCGLSAVRRASTALMLALAARVLLLAVVDLLWEQATLAEVCQQLLKWVAHSGHVGVVVFLICYAGFDMAGVPLVALTASAGALFGPVVGVAAVLLGGVLGSLGSFALARIRAWN